MICSVCLQHHYIASGNICERCLIRLLILRNKRLAYIAYAIDHRISLVQTCCKIHGYEWNARFIADQPRCPSCDDIENVRFGIIAPRPKGYAE